MNNDEAKFLLSAYRPDGSDATDPAFAAALEQAAQDPELRSWFEAQRQFDALLTAKVRSVAPPAGLREAILAGTRVSVARRPVAAWWRRPVWLTAAAGLALVLGLTLLLPSSRRPTGADLAAFALRDLDEAHDAHVGAPPDLAAVQAALARAAAPLTTSLELDGEQLRARHCRSVRLGGRELFEICFERDGIWYHLYVGRRQDFAPGDLDPMALKQTRGALAATAWTGKNAVYALATHAGIEALNRVL